MDPGWGQCICAEAGSSVRGSKCVCVCRGAEAVCSGAKTKGSGFEGVQRSGIILRESCDGEGRLCVCTILCRPRSTGICVQGSQDRGVVQGETWRQVTGMCQQQIALGSREEEVGRVRSPGGIQRGIGLD